MTLDPTAPAVPGVPQPSVLPDAQTVEPPPVEEEERRTWSLREWRALNEPRTEDESRLMAIQRLRSLIRNDGYVIDESTVTPSAPMPAFIDTATNTPYQVDDNQEPEGHLITWTAGAFGRGADDDSSLLTPVQIAYLVPEPFRSQGGGVRLRHNLGRGVTVTAYDVNGDATGYLLATALDEHQEHVEIMPQTARLLVTPDPV